MKQQNTGLIVKSKLTEKYTIIPNAILKDPKLSLKSKGLLCILLSLPSDWAVYKSQLQQFSSDGRDSTTSSFNELVENGYITAIRRINNKGQFMGWDYIVYNERVEPITENPITENPYSVNPSLQSTKEQSKDIKSKDTSIYTGETNKLFKTSEYRQMLNEVFPDINDWETQLNKKGITAFCKKHDCYQVEVVNLLNDFIKS
jgi:hypothetical protein